jgi:5-methylcytosine-specific restriction endonuclease McrA
VKKLFKFGAIFVLIFFAGSVIGQQKVRGYYRKDGTYVSEYTRRARVSGSGRTLSESSEATTDTYSVPRDKHGKIKRSETSKALFEFTTPCPSTGNRSGKCPGYVIDHINPLACGGADATFNMQWQTVAEGKAKDKWERKACGK